MRLVNFCDLKPILGTTVAFTVTTLAGSCVLQSKIKHFRFWKISQLTIWLQRPVLKSKQCSRTGKACPKQCCLVNETLFYIIRKRAKLRSNFERSGTEFCFKNPALASPQQQTNVWTATAEK
jgi:hypothetical protein